jgi:YD repeat-containing protein
MAVAALAAGLEASVAQPGPAATLEHDAAGHVSRITTPDGDAVRYRYDAFGNLLAVVGMDEARPPRVDSVAPDALRAGAEAMLTIGGEHLAAVSVDAPAGLTATITSASATLLTLALAVDRDLPPGFHQISLANDDGSADLAIEVLPPLPRLLARPLPIALADDGTPAEIVVALSNADIVPREIGLSVGNPALVDLLDSAASIAAGDTEARVRLRGLGPGLTQLRLTAAELTPASFTVYVTAEAGALNSAFAAPLGVRVGPPPVSPETAIALAASPLGVVRGPRIDGIAPAAVAADGAPVRLTISGAGLAQITSAGVEPEDGLTVDALDVAPDGLSVGLTVTADPAAARGARRLRLAGSSAPTPASPGADALHILDPSPEIDSIDPTHLQRGRGPQWLTLRGRYLDQVTGLRILPAEGIRIATTGIAVEAGRRWLVDVAADAPLGERLVIADSPVGASADPASAANRLWIIDTPPPMIHGLSAAPVGVRVGASAPDTPRSAEAVGTILGVTVGATVQAVTPRQVEVGTSADLTLTGAGLESVDVVALDPAEGIDVVGLLADPLGESLLVQLDIAPDAPDTWRRLQVYAADRELPFADPAQAALRVTLPLPVIAGIEPRAIPADGGAVTLTLVGTHLQNADALFCDPPLLTFGAPSIAPDGRRLSVIASPRPGAATGHTRVSLRTPAGTSTREPTPANTLTLFRDARVPPSVLAAPPVGVAVGSPPDPVQRDVLLAAPALGVRLGPANSDRPTEHLTAAPALGIVTGPFVTAVEAPPLLPGGTYSLHLSGHGLDAVDGAALFPGLDLALSSPTQSPDGTTLSLLLTIPSDAEPTARELRLLANDRQVTFAHPRLAVIAIDDGPPEIHSIWPIQANAGETLTLAIRGVRLDDVSRVYVEPAAGMQFSWQRTVEGDGTLLTVRVQVAADAPPGARTIRVETPGGASSAADAAANRFTVY